MHRHMRMISYLIMMLFASFSAHAQSSALFNEAVALANQIGPNVSIETRLDLYSRAFKNLDQITDQYPESPETLRLLTGQTVGNFNPEKLRSSYIAELTTYYKKVCEVNPSYRCLGFVSLDIGMTACQKAANFNDLDQAHRHVQNAIRIFNGPNEDKNFLSLALGAYRQCSAGRPNLSKWYKDYFSSKLSDILVDVGNINTAKALIQNMETPIFKFEGVLKLKSVSADKFDLQSIDRLRRYIQEDLAPKARNPEQSADAFFADLKLRMYVMNFLPDQAEYAKMINPSDVAIYGSSLSVNPMVKSCDGQFISSFINQIFDYKELLYKTFVRTKIDRENILKMNSISFGDGQYAFVKSIFDNCKKGEYYDLWSMFVVHGALLSDLGLNGASEFRSEMERRALSSEEIKAYYLKAVQPKASTIVWSFINEENKGMVAEEMSLGISIRAIYGHMKTPQEHATMPIFKYLVDGGDVCNSSTLLFRNIAKTNRYNEAVSFIVNSKSINASASHKCGNAELELLLK